MSHAQWNRREFLAVAGMAGAGAALRLRAPGLRAYVGFAAGSIGVFQVGGGHWREGSGSWPHRAPSALALHPALPVLYAAHGNDRHAHLPRGSLSAYRIDSEDGGLAYRGTTPLALSATFPTHLAVAPDGQTLVAPASGGGAYNFFALAPDGMLLGNPHALKQTGFGPHPRQVCSAPRAALFHPGNGALYATDFGTDRVNHFTIEDGVPALASRRSLEPGSGPAALALHPSGRFLIVVGELRPSLTVLPIDRRSGRLGAPVQRIAVDADTAGPVAVGDRVYLAAARLPDKAFVLSYKFSPRTPALRWVGRIQVGGFGEVAQLALCEDRLLLAGQGGVLALAVDPRTGLTGKPLLVVRKEGALSLAFGRAGSPRSSGKQWGVGV